MASSQSCIGADGLLGPRAEFHFILKAEDPHHIADEIGDRPDLGVELLRRAEDVGVVLGKLAHPHQAVQHARLFVAVNRAQLEIAQRQVAVGADLATCRSSCGRGSSSA